MWIRQHADGLVHGLKHPGKRRVPEQQRSWQPYRVCFVNERCLGSELRFWQENGVSPLGIKGSYAGAIGSVACYLKMFGWQAKAPVAPDRSRIQTIPALKGAVETRHQPTQQHRAIG